MKEDKKLIEHAMKGKIEKIGVENLKNIKEANKIT